MENNKTMTYTFLINEEMPVPRITINEKRLGVVSFDLSYKTDTDESIGKYIAIVSGYFPQERQLRTFKVNLRLNKCVEVSET